MNCTKKLQTGPRIAPGFLKLFPVCGPWWPSGRVGPGRLSGRVGAVRWPRESVALSAIKGGCPYEPEGEATGWVSGAYVTLPYRVEVQMCSSVSVS